ncbi:MAG TPA: DUF1614 domain-containing protein [Candidatus Thermoplasmatota archaeon]|nr:DUF1614 domain-containing protein [Candidatus Thermoplasmatota archaeon]
MRAGARLLLALLLATLVAGPAVAQAAPVRVLEPGHFLYFTVRADAPGENFAATGRVQAGPEVRLLVLDAEGFQRFREGKVFKPHLERADVRSFDVRFSVPRAGEWYAVVDHAERRAGLPAEFASLAVYRVAADGARVPLGAGPTDPFNAHFPLATGVEMTWLSLVFLGASLIFLPRKGVAFLSAGALVVVAYFASTLVPGRGVVVHLGFVVAAALLAARHVRVRTNRAADGFRTAFAGSFLGLLVGGDALHILFAPDVVAATAAVGGYLVIGGDGLADGIIAGPVMALALHAADWALATTLAGGFRRSRGPTAPETPVPE